MEKKFKENKFAAFFKKNIYLILMVLCLAAIAAMITITVIRNQQDAAPVVTDNPGDDQSLPVDSQNPGDNPGENPGEQQTNPTDPTPTVLTVMSLPIADAEVLKPYVDTALVYNATMKHWATHQAVDFVAAEGCEVKAVFDGDVISVVTSTLRGTVVTVKHSGGFESVYSLLGSDVKVKAGDKVKKGDVLGYVSTVGTFEIADGPHLHFEFKKDGELVNPDYYFEGGNK